MNVLNCVCNVYNAYVYVLNCVYNVYNVYMNAMYWIVFKRIKEIVDQ